jgi:hypothetical protein
MISLTFIMLVLGLVWFAMAACRVRAAMAAAVHSHSGAGFRERAVAPWSHCLERTESQ